MRVTVLADFSEFYNRATVHGAAAFARDAGWELSQHHVTDRARLAEAIHSADALLLGPHQMESDTLITRSGLPMVGFSATLWEAHWPRVLSDDLAVGRAVAEHFLAQSIRSFAFYTDVDGVWVERRREGFAARLDAEGYLPNQLAPSKARSPKSLLAWLRDLPRPVGLMLAHDPAATHVLVAAKTLGLRVPEDLLLVGVNDDDRMRDALPVSLSTVPLQTFQIGHAAASLLARVIKRAPGTPWSMLIPPGELIVRQSSDLFGNAEGVVARAICFIRDRLPDGVESKQVVSHVGTCRATLNSKFQSLLGRTVAQEIRRARLELCRRLLSTTDLPMHVVAEKSGFSSPRQLSETFHQYVGLTPSQFRSQFRTGG